MNTPINRKQIVVLALSAVLAVVSYWIPLSPESQALNPVTQATPSTLIDSTPVLASR
jgi:hypothetical protein